METEAKIADLKAARDELETLAEACETQHEMFSRTHGWGTPNPFTAKYHEIHREWLRIVNELYSLETSKTDCY